MMNERIRELAVEARLLTGWPVGEVEYQKFAELIVRTCIAKCDDLNSMKYIANHFRVEVKGLTDE